MARNAYAPAGQPRWKSLCRRLRFRFLMPDNNVVEVDVMFVTPAESRRWTGPEWSKVRIGPLMLMVSLTT
jgi:hypothetical protein